MANADVDGGQAVGDGRGKEYAQAEYAGVDGAQDWVDAEKTPIGKARNLVKASAVKS